MSDDRKRPESLRPSQLLKEGEELAREAYEARQNKRPNGPAIGGFPRLSEQLCESFCPGLHGLLGEPGSGKSAFGAHLAEESGVPTLIVCAEMPPLEYLHRSAARRSETYIGKFRDGTLSPEQWRHYVGQAASALPHLMYLDGTKAKVYLEDIRESFEILQEIFYSERIELGEHKPEVRKHGLILVDSVSAWARSMDGNLTENDRVSESLRRLQQLAEEFRIAIIGVGEQNRIARNSDSQMSGKGSSVWEYGVWTQMSLEKIGKADDQGNRDIMLTLSKNRRGREGCKVPLWFEGGFMRFSEREHSVKADQGNESSANGVVLGPGKKYRKNAKAPA